MFSVPYALDSIGYNTMHIFQRSASCIQEAAIIVLRHCDLLW